MFKVAMITEIVYNNNNNNNKVPIVVGLWYFTSLAALWINRYLLATLKVDSNLLSFAQLFVSVLCGFASEIHLVGWERCKQDMVRVFRDGTKDMVLLGAIRILSVMLGLTALKYISVSFTQTIKSAAPFFSVVFTYLLLGQKTGWRVNGSLLPIVIGLMSCTFSDTSFHPIGFTAAVLSNCVDCIQNVLTKRLLNKKYASSQLQLYTSIMASGMQLTYLFYAWSVSPRTSGISSSVAAENSHSSVYLVLVLMVAGSGFYLQSFFAYFLMSIVSSPVTHSVANCVKRALLITLSIWYYGDTVKVLNWLGICLVILGVYAYSSASRVERALVDQAKTKTHELKKNDALPVTVTKPSSHVEVKTIAELSEIRISMKIAPLKSSV